MKKSTLSPNIFVNKIADHNKHKSVLLKYFSQGGDKIDDGIDNITNTDWYNNGDLNREWIHYFKDNVLNQIQDNLLNERSAVNLTLHNIWFQQYEQDNVHEWHTHGFTQYTNVYYVELPDTSLKTEILDEEDIEVEEGDILSFPAYIFHRSKINKTNKRKTIISFNTSFDRINIDKINKT